jgi:23S rRNA pseudouridine1911/1915/1917 synthase
VDGEGGVGRLAFTVGDELAGQRVDQGLAMLAGVPRAQARRWIDAGRVRLDGRPVARPSHKLGEGARLEADPPEPTQLEIVPEPIPLAILHEDSELIVIDKAAGMVVHPAPGHGSGTLVHALLHHCGDLAGVGGVLRPGIVHRLDAGTTGVMVVAKTDAAHLGLSAQFQDHSIERVYRAVVRGVPRTRSGRVDRPIGRHPRDRKRMSVRTRSGREAATCWKLLERFPASEHAWLEIRPETGRTHQIRVHLASIGLPIHADAVYGRSRRVRVPGIVPLERPALHAAVLGFDHPVEGRRLRFEAPLPDDMTFLLASLRAREPSRG